MQKNDIARRAYMVTVLRTQASSDEFGKVRKGVKRYFSSTVSRTLSKFGLRQVNICNFTRIGRKTEEQEHTKVQKNDIARRAYMVTV